MKWIDMISQAFSNLMRRKLRSGLTMLGVVIGTAAIVVTISLGYGAEKTQMEALQSMSNLRMIYVSPMYGGSSSSTGRRITKITDGVIETLRKVEGVEAITPAVYVYMGAEGVLIEGKQEMWPMLTAVYPKDFMKMQKLKEGRYFTSNTSQMEFLMSEMAMMEFRDPNSTEEYYSFWDFYDSKDPLPLPKIDWLKARFNFQLRWEVDDESSDPDAEPVMMTRDMRARMVGYMDGRDYTSLFSWGTIISIDWLKRFQRENKAFLKDHGASESDGYDTVYVMADSVDNVTRVAKDLADLGVQCSNDMGIIEQMRAQIATMQGFLGFIGMISMAVAALSIANTMMMSIYERTREIGVMKVLGCKLGNIRIMFLSEAAFIGLIGGLLGLVVSYGLSYALNNVESLRNILNSVMSSTQVLNDDGTGQLSIIPAQLAVMTWLGVSAVSILSGVQPAQRAMSLSSLAAIRSAD